MTPEHYALRVEKGDPFVSFDYKTIDEDGQLVQNLKINSTPQTILANIRELRKVYIVQSLT